MTFFGKKDDSERTFSESLPLLASMAPRPQGSSEEKKRLLIDLARALAHSVSGLMDPQDLDLDALKKQSAEYEKAFSERQSQLREFWRQMYGFVNEAEIFGSRIAILEEQSAASDLSEEGKAELEYLLGLCEQWAFRRQEVLSNPPESSSSASRGSLWPPSVSFPSSGKGSHLVAADPHGMDFEFEDGPAFLGGSGKLEEESSSRSIFSSLPSLHGMRSSLGSLWTSSPKAEGYRPLSSVNSIEDTWTYVGDDDGDETAIEMTEIKESEMEEMKRDGDDKREVAESPSKEPEKTKSDHRGLFDDTWMDFS